MSDKATNRRDFLRSVGAYSASAAWQGRTAQRDRPNIIFLLTDDLRADGLGVMGNRIVQTPNIDRMAERAITFDNHFVTTSICMASRSSIFTGLHTRAHGVVSFDQPLRPTDFAASYPVLMRTAGYRTGFIGKWGVGKVLPTTTFDYFRGFAGQGHYFPKVNGEAVHLTNLMCDQAMEFLDGCTPERPFCLSISFKAPHVQDEDPRQYLYDPALGSLYANERIPVPKTAAKKYFDAEPEFIRNSLGHERWPGLFNTEERYQEMVKGYYRLITGVDMVVGRIREALTARGCAGNTVIIFTSDNGFFLGERQLSHKFLMYEESIRVPLIIFDPRLGPARQSQRRSEMTLNIDLAPTMLDLSGVPRPVAMQGRSLRPLLETRLSEWRRDWFYEHSLTLGGRIPASDGVRTARWKYIRYPENSPVYEELYDLEHDTLEERNLVREPKYFEVLEKLRARRQVWSSCLDGWNRNSPWTDPKPFSL